MATTTENRSSALVFAESEQLNLRINHAHAVVIDIDDGDYTNIGSGIGIGNGQLGLQFTESIPSGLSPFNLNNVGDSFTFKFGEVELDENDIDGSGNDSETNNLGVTATLLFDDPFDGTTQSIAVVGAVAGDVDDNGVDVTITFNPIQAAFGAGGLLEIDFWDLSFRDEGDKDHKVTITLKALPGTQTQVPEPGTLALLAGGLLGLGVLRRRKTA